MSSGVTKVILKKRLKKLYCRYRRTATATTQFLLKGLLK